MGFLNRIFGAKGRQGEENAQAEAGMHIVPSHRPPVTVTLDTLRQLFPIRNLDDDELAAFALERKAEVYGPGSILFYLGNPADYAYYLLEGTVAMKVDGGKTYTVDADTAKARFPLCAGKRHTATAEALTDIQVLRVSAKIMALGSAKHGAPHILDVHDPEIPALVRDSHLFQAFCQYYREEELHIPSLPEVAFKLDQAIRDDVGMAEVARIIQLDPVIAAKLVHVANSPLYLPARPIQTCHDAVNRLGLVATRNLVTGFALRQVFKCKDPYLAKVFLNCWKQSVYLSALCYVLATDNPGINREEALFAGLIADIGMIPFLYFADHCPRELWWPADVEAVIPHVRGPVGAYLLRHWDFPETLADMPLRAEDWYHDGGETLGLADIVILSKLHSYIGTPRMANLPAINAIPACGKLKDGRLSPEYSLQVLHEARDQIAQIMKFFDS